MDHTQNPVQKEAKKGFTGLQVFAIVCGSVVLAVVITLAVAWNYLFPRPFKPVVLSPSEQTVLEQKLDRVESVAGSPVRGEDTVEKWGAGEQDHDQEGRLVPKPYSEEGASREVVFTERELNALIATNTDLATRMALDLAENLVSARMLVPVDPDFPVFGGKTLRVRAGVEVAYREGKPVVRLKGVSLMGVPMPNAWLGGMKNIDLVREFSGDEGFWKTFADGVESISVQEGRVRIVLKE